MARTIQRFSEEIVTKSCELAEKGYMDKEIAEYLNVKLPTWYKWKAKYPEFAEAMRKAKFKANEQIEAALIKQALGYEVEEQEVIVNVGKNGEKVNRIKKHKKHIQGDTKLLLVLLRNRIPEKYKDSEKQQIDISGNISSSINLQSLSDEELLKEIEKLK